MSMATHLSRQNPPSHPLANNVIVITKDPRDRKITEFVRKEIRQSGCTCEIFPADISDRTQLRQMLRDVLERLHHVGAPWDDAAIPRNLLVRKLTDEEWLAQ